jgi:hypothetical protein
MSLSVWCTYVSPQLGTMNWSSELRIVDLAFLRRVPNIVEYELWHCHEKYIMINVVCFPGQCVVSFIITHASLVVFVCHCTVYNVHVLAATVLLYPVKLASLS